MKEELPIYVVYDHPSDYPDSYVVRKFNIDKPEGIIINDVSLEKVRNKLEGMSLYNLGRSEGDDPKILECWI